MVKNYALSKPPEPIFNLIQKTFGSHDAKIICDLSKDIQDYSALEKLFTFINNEVPEMESVDIGSKEVITYFTNRIALYLKVDLSFLKNTNDKDISYQIAEKIIREYLYNIIDTAWETNPQKARKGIITIKKAIDKISVVENIEKEKLLAITGILEIEKVIVRSDKEVNNPSELYFIFEEKYRNKLNGLGEKLRDEYQCINSKAEFIDALHNPEKKQLTLRYKSEKKLEELIGVILILKKWKILKVKGGNGFWRHLQSILVDNRKNLITKNLNKYASELRDNKLLISNLEKFLIKEGFKNISTNEKVPRNN